MSTRSRASQWFGPRSASAPLQYKAPPQEPVSFIGWDFGSGCDVAVLGEWQNGVLHVLDRIERYDLTSNYEDTQMSDFEVGDVVRLAGTSTQGKITERRTNPEIDGWVVDIESFGKYFYLPCNLVLVSRPSDATTKPALKVGDRVRMLAGPYADQNGVVARAGGEGEESQFIHQYVVRAEHGGHYCFDAHELELLPPEPAPAWIPDEFEWLANKKPYAGSIYDKVAKPMTATTASILGNNQTDPMRDFECAHEIDVMRYMMRDIWGHGERAMISGPMALPDHNGWMPAGTYMPVVKAPWKVMPPRKPTLPPQSVRLNGDGFGSGIEAKGIKKTNRLICHQTRSWDPMDDTFLEDA